MVDRTYPQGQEAPRVELASTAWKDALGYSPGEPDEKCLSRISDTYN